MYSRRIALFVDIFPPSMGGGATRAFCIVKSLMALNYDVTVVTTSCTYPTGKSILSLTFEKKQQKNLTIIRVPSLNLPFKGVLNRLLNYSFSAISMLVIAPKLRNFNTVISIGMHPFTDLAAYLTKISNSKSKLIVDISDIFPDESLFKIVNHALNRFLLLITDSLFLHNERLEKIFNSRYNIHKQITVVHNAVDTTTFKPNYLTRKKKMQLSEICGRNLVDTFVICYFGVLGPFQGLDRVVKAAAKLQNEFNDLVFCIIGDGEAKLQLQNLVSKLNNIYLIPKMEREKIAQIATEVDLGLAPIVSKDPNVVYVNLPSKAAEFLSSGVPILAAKGTYIGQLIKESNAGYEIDFNNIDNICEVIRDIYYNREQLLDMSLAARNLAITTFSLENIQKSLKALNNL